MPGKVDIGRIIKDTLKSRNMSVSAFAESINCTERNVYKIFNKPSIDTAMLAKINKVLNKNLFIHFIQAEETLDILISKNPEKELIEVVRDLQVTLRLLKSFENEKLKK